jgi:hypothetical protein
MARFKPIRPGGGSSRKTKSPQGAIGCVILILLGIIGVMFFMYLAMTGNANR